MSGCINCVPELPCTKHAQYSRMERYLAASVAMPLGVLEPPGMEALESIKKQIARTARYIIGWDPGSPEGAFSVDEHGRRIPHNEPT